MRPAARVLVGVLTVVGGLVSLSFATSTDDRIGPRFEPPGVTHPFGTDRYGRDLLRRWWVGGSTSLGIALGAALGAAATGTVFGAIGALAPRPVRAVIDRLTEAVLSLPRLYVPIVVASAIGPGARTTTAVLALTTWMPVSRIVRQEIESHRTSEWYFAAVSVGCGPLRRAAVHLCPHLAGPLTAETASLASQALLAETALTYFGLGMQPPDASWGAMLSGSLDSLPESGWALALATVSIGSAALGFAMVGDAVHSIADRETAPPPRRADL